MTTYTKLRADIVNWLNNESVELADTLDTLIDLGERRLARDADLRTFRNHAVAPVQGGDAYLYMPADCLVVRGLRFVGGEHLRLRPESFLHEFWPNPLLTARPKYYGHWNARFVFLAPTPDADAEMEVTYTARPAGLSAEAPTTWLSLHAYDALLYACLIEAGGYLEGVTPERLAVYQQRYGEALARLQGQESRNLVDDF